MIDTVLTVVWPFAAALVASVLEVLFSRTKAFGKSHVRELKLPKLIWQIKWKDKTGETALSFLIIWSAALLQFLFSMVSVFIVRKWANLPQGSGTSPVSHVFFAVAAVVSDICILCLLRGRNRKDSKAAVIIAVSSFAVLACELFLFNFNSFKKDPHNVTIKGSDIKPEFAMDAESEDGCVRYFGGSIIVKESCSLMIPDVPDDAYSFTVHFSGTAKDETGRFRLRLMIEDANSMYKYRTSDIRKTGGFCSTTLFLKPYGKVGSVMLSLEELEKTVRIDYITVSDCNIYSAMPARYIAVLLAVSLVTLILCLKLYKVDFDSSKKLHASLLALMFVFTTGLTYLLYFNKDMKLDKYPLKDTTKVNDIYQLAFDSSIKHLPFLDIPVDDSLKELDSPYDAGEREKKKTVYKWDYAYKDGKYYCYFGMAPVYTLYYPLYMITHRIPNYTSAVCIFGTYAAIGVILAFLAAVRMFVPKKNLLALMLMIPAVAAASFIYTNMTHSEKYYIACESALAFAGFTVFFGLTAVKCRRPVLRFVLFFLSGLSLALCAGSRPTVAICAAVLLPAFFGVLFDKKRKLSLRIYEALIFVVPVIIGIALIMLHNYQRFGNVLDFGENYQLTVSNISSLKTTPEMFPSAIYYFFLIPYSAMDTFPYFEARGILTYSYEIYRNIEPSAGLLNIPLLLLGIVFVPGAFIRAKGRITRKDAAVCNGFILTCIAVSLFITWFDFSRGGVCIRYLSDFSWILAILSGVILLRRISGRAGRKTVYGIVCATCILTVFAAFFIMLADDGCNLTKIYPTLLEHCEDFFLFWH